MTSLPRLSSFVFPGLACLCVVATRPLLADVKPGGSPANAPAKADDLPKPAPRGDDAGHVAMADVPPFLGLFGSADLLAKVGFRSEVGRYIDFKAEADNVLTAKGTGVRFAQVPPEVPGRRWIEVTALGSGVGGNGMRLLTKGASKGNIERIIIQSSQTPPMEVPLNSMTSSMPLNAPGGPAGSSLNSDVKHLGHERVTVPLGTFETEHWMVSSEHDHLLEIWTTTDPKVPFTGVVQMRTDKGLAVAEKVGSNAEPSISVPPKNGQ